MEGPGDGLDLPDWSSALLTESFDDVSPPKKPLATATLKDGNTQRVSALGPWKPAPAAAAAAAHKPAFAAAVAPAPAPPARSQSDAENNDAALQPQPEAPRSVRRTHTPSRTGLTARAVRPPPSRLGLTPGAKPATEQFEVPASARAVAAPATGKNLKSILKRLNFSATKAKAAATVAAAPTGGDAPHTLARPAQPAAAAAESTIKQLRFDMGGVTPAAATAAKQAGRHVSFDAATVSPAARGVRALGSAGPSSTLPARTPEPAIAEEASEEGSQEGSQGGASTVNSAAAGHTPYDRRLSSLFAKYHVGGLTPELPDSELEDLLAAGGAARSPSWKRLSSASVPESIRELARKYDARSDSESLRGLTATPPALGSAAAAAAAAAAEAREVGEEAGTPVAAGAGAQGSSPALAPTPHSVLNSVMRRNDLFEGSPAQASPAGAAAAVASDNGAAPPSPASALAQLLAPVLLATIDEVGAGKQAQGTPARAGASPAPGAPSPAFSSPAEFYGFPAASPREALEGVPAGGGATPAAPRSASVDGVPRDADGIPTFTPGTVTVRRGSGGLGLGVVLEEDGDLLAANLFGGDEFGAGRGSFSPLGDGARAFSPGSGSGSPGAAFGSPALDQGEQAACARDGQRQQQQQAEAAATPAGAGADSFSFFPSAGGQRPAAAAAAAVAGTTPELVAAGGQGAGGSQISPEILGFYEQQEAQQAQRAAATPVMPKSIIKSGRPLTQGGSPVLGHAQRGGPADQPPPTITRELQALMADLRLEDPSRLQEMGTVSALSPVRTSGKVKGFLGGLARAITPVRRSARKKAPHRPLEELLEETGFSYVPNAALMADDAPPKQEAAEARAARKAASRASSQAAGEPSLAGDQAAAAADAQPEVSSAPPASEQRRHSTRSVPRELEAASEPAAQTAGPSARLAATPEVAPPSSRRMSLRHLRTPMQMAHMGAADENAATPAANAPVAQDASPQLAESPSCVAAAAAAAASGGRAYGFRSSTLKARQSVGTPLAGGAVATPTAGAASGKKGRQGPQLSPTEQGIRASLRRSARKSKGGAADDQ